jgi:hypothetical protein
MRTELARDRNTTYLSVFVSRKNIHFMGNRPIQRIREAHLSPINIPSMLEAEVSCPLLLGELRMHLKRILPMCQHFQVEEIFNFWELALFS